MTRPDELKVAIERAQKASAGLDDTMHAMVKGADLRTLIAAARQAEAWREAALAERERCALLADSYMYPDETKISAAIRDAILALPAPEPKDLT